MDNIKNIEIIQFYVLYFFLIFEKASFSHVKDDLLVKRSDSCLFCLMFINTKKKKYFTK